MFTTYLNAMLHAIAPTFSQQMRPKRSFRNELAGHLAGPDATNIITPPIRWFSILLPFVCIVFVVIFSSSAAAQNCPKELMFPGTKVLISDDNAFWISSPALGDLDNDGDLDVVLLKNKYASSVYVLSNNGDGTFDSQNAVQYGTGNDPSHLKLVDLNHDSILDIVTTNSQSNDASVLLGHGDGTFSAETRYATGNRPVDLEIGDLNNDGTLDLVTANQLGHTISVLLGNGDGTFTADMPFTPGVAPYRIALGDIDNDGFTDIVYNDTSSTYIARGNGDGTFDTPLNFSAVFGTDLSLEDINADGNVDLLMSRYDGIAVSIGHGDSSFDPEVLYDHGDLNQTLVDIDLDGDLDIVSSGYRMVIHFNNGNGLFSTYNEYQTLLADHTAVGDMDNDGDMDIVYSYKYQNNGVPAYASVAFNNGDTDFDAPEPFSLVSDVIDIDTGDIDQDGDIDVAVLTSNETLHTYIHQGDGSLMLYQSYNVTGFYAKRLRLFDLDADGNLDMIVATTDSNNISVFLGIGNGNFGPETKYPCFDKPNDLRFGDLNNDGFTDIVVGSVANLPNDQICYLPGNGDGTFANYISISTGEGGPSRIDVGDVNADGNLDIVTSSWALDDITVIFGNGDGTFTGSTQYSAGHRPGRINLYDIDNDGDLDIIINNYASSNMMVYRNHGDGTYAPKKRYPVGEYPTEHTLADMNGDGFVDIVVANRDDASMSILIGKGDGTFESEMRVATVLSPYFNAPVDMDGDGDIDILSIPSATAYLSGYILFNHCTSPGHCPADLNNDGLANTQDFILFLNLWSSNDPQADWNNDGSINSQDFLAYLNDWSVGC